MLFTQHHLRATSSISIGVECSTMLLVAFYSRKYSMKDNEIVPFRDAKSERLQYFIGPDVFLGLPAFLFALVGHHASFEVYRSLKKPSFSSWETVANWSFFFAWALSTLMCTSAWLNLGDSIEGNIVSTYAPTDTPTLVSKILLAITMNVTYPVEMFVSRNVLNQGIFVSILGKGEHMPLWRHFLITVSIWAATFVIGKFTASVNIFPLQLLH